MFPGQVPPPPPPLPGIQLTGALFEERFKQFHMDIARGQRNVYNNPVFDILRVSILLKLYDIIKGMLFSGHTYSKQVWKNLVWDRIRRIENEDWSYRVSYFSATALLHNTMSTPAYSNWWTLSDSNYEFMMISETMVKSVSRASNLKSDHYKFIVRVSNQGFSQIPKTFRDLVNSLFHSGI